MGIAGDCTNSWKDYFTELLIIDQLRGTHSTGVAAIERSDNSTVIVKKPGPPSEILGLKEYREAMSNPLHCIIGHNRYATKGARTEENAHPFDFEHVVGAHNGTLDHYTIRDLHDNAKFGTDSQAIFSHMNKYGLKDTLKQMQGAWALTWFDKRDNTINFLRNEKRPLYYTYSKDHSTLLWASEHEFLELVCKRHNLHKGLEGEQIYIVTPDTHYSWKVPKFFSDKFEFPVQEEAKSTRSFQSSGYYNHSPYGTGWFDQMGDYCEWDQDLKKVVKYNNSETNKVPTKKSDLFDNRNSATTAGTGNILPFKPDPKPFSRVDTTKFRQPYRIGPKEVLNKKDFNRLISQGCMLCGDCMTEWGKFIHILPHDLTGKRQYLCEECYNEDDALEIVQQLMEA